MIFQIMKNSVPEKDLELYMVESDRFMFADNSTGDEIGDGILLLKIILGDIKPSTVMNVQDLEEKLASETVRKYENKLLSCVR